jgi:hypothetical protein
MYGGSEATGPESGHGDRGLHAPNHSELAHSTTGSDPPTIKKANLVDVAFLVAFDRFVHAASASTNATRVTGMFFANLLLPNLTWTRLGLRIQSRVGFRPPWFQTHPLEV